MSESRLKADRDGYKSSTLKRLDFSYWCAYFNYLTNHYMRYSYRRGFAEEPC
jgi:hypothetical protein